MKKFLLLIFVFFVIVFAVDRIVGKTLEYMSRNTHGGYIAHRNYILDKVTEDLLVFGSSRCVDHYNTTIMSDSLGLSTYNCGMNGNGIILFYGWWHIIKQHHKPKIIIYDIFPKVDYFSEDDNHKFLGWLKDEYNRDGIPDIFESVDNTEKYKMQSYMYRYNFRFMRILTDFYHPIHHFAINGFMAEQGIMDSTHLATNTQKKNLIIDSLKLEYLHKFIEETTGSKLIFTISPIFNGFNEETLTPIKKICKEKNIPLIDFSNDPKYVHHYMYFKDAAHLNANGADEFTKDLVSKLKEMNLLEDLTIN